MEKKKILIFFILLITIFLLFKYFNISNKDKNSKKIIEPAVNTMIVPNSNIISDVKYLAYDVKGNKYTINAKRGEIDLSNSNIIFLTDVIALI